MLKYRFWIAKLWRQLLAASIIWYCIMNYYWIISTSKIVCILLIKSLFIKNLSNFYYQNNNKKESVIYKSFGTKSFWIVKESINFCFERFQDYFSFKLAIMVRVSVWVFFGNKIFVFESCRLIFWRQVYSPVIHNI